ncbi:MULTISPECIES: paraquat-inducible protein A [Pseudomonas]|uniref:Putative paraquat-inducible protein A n=1 Tax=Pseudomonas luteola TaxID=47886 RepID=A0A2X2BZI0_PSELU|nr:MULTISPECIES: paraquat-inducible protein A [Pseudomonas]MCG7373985.1 paraquat-inducible protein A [Pseudomonas luteola]RRW40687.1 paraquat-inducible protein A [Pseudomonas luteola]SHJ43624.1 paraquat-inducible protein A [Pseudomonas zeshuii]SPZ00161.1 putative paraquat-inducible protein A [Pseudomonas luteola]
MSFSKGSLALSVCEHCDSIYHRRPLVRGEAARCVRCDAVIERSRRLSIEQLLALTLAAAIMFILANVFPIMHINLQGLSNEATLWDSVKALAQGRITLVALVAGVTIIFAPLLQIILLGWVLGYAYAGKTAPGFSACMRALEHLRAWSMLEVCLLGILVAIIKLAGMLNVSPGIGLWAMSMLTVLIILIGGRDIRYLWDDLEVPVP